MATMMHTIHSDSIAGIGTIDGGPYADSYPWHPTLVDQMTEHNIRTAINNEALGQISDTSNLNGAPVYIFSGA